MKYSFNYENNHYSILSDSKNNTLSITINDKTNIIRVKEHYSDYVYSIKKTFLGCKSIENLISHFRECIENDFAVNAWCIEPLNKMMEIKQFEILQQK